MNNTFIHHNGLFIGPFESNSIANDYANTHGIHIYCVFQSDKIPELPSPFLKDISDKTHFIGLSSSFKYRIMKTEDSQLFLVNMNRPDLPIISLRKDMTLKELLTQYTFEVVEEK